MTSSKDSGWRELSGEVRKALSGSWRNGMPGAASALYSRWWQLETWLRSLVYIELRSFSGPKWIEALSAAAADRQERDQENRHMPTPDAQDLLAYLDASLLLKITHDHWSIFRKYLPAQKIWAGRVEELKAIRNRIGHCRKPHADDLDRLEQTLRDLNAGAFLAMSSFNEHSRPRKEWSDVLVRDWIHKEHDTARRLIDHADIQYETTFNLMVSKRPWADHLVEDEVELGAKPGYIWHACWYFRGGKSLDLARFWKYLEYDRDLILMACAESPSSLQLSFSSVDDQKAISEVISRAFDAALNTLSLRPTEEEYGVWSRRYSDLDPRVQVMTPWAGLDSSMHGINIFAS